MKNTRRQETERSKGPLSAVRSLNELAFAGGCLCVRTQLYFALKRMGPQVSGSKMRQVETTSVHLFLDFIFYLSGSDNFKVTGKRK